MLEYVLPLEARYWLKIEMNLGKDNLEQVSLMSLSSSLFIGNMRPWYLHVSVAENVKWDSSAWNT